MEEEAPPVGTYVTHGTVYDCIVVGAGMAGLRCAQQLRSRGVANVLVLEAGVRCGGRTHTMDVPLSGAHGTGGSCVPVDLGGAWLHGRGHAVWQCVQRHKRQLPLLRPRYGRDVLECTAWGTQATREQRWQDASIAQDALQEIHCMVEHAKHVAASKGQRELSIGDARRDSLARGRLASAVEAGGPSTAPWQYVHQQLSGLEQYEASDADDLGLVDDVPYVDGGGDTMLRGGYRSLMAWMLRNGAVGPLQGADACADDATLVSSVSLDGVRLSHRVTHIQCAPGGAPVRIVAQCGEQVVTLSARTVVVTVSLGVLKADALAFEPPLPQAKASAIQAIGFGVMNKCVLVFDRVFWPASAASIGLGTPKHGHFRWFFNLAPSSGQAVLVAFNCGSNGHWQEKQGDAVVVATAMRLLRTVYPDAPDPVNHVVTRWASDPLFRGSYTHVAPGTTAAHFAALRTPEAEGRLWFAGEATAKRAYGTVHGAFQSGERVARKVTAWLQKHA